VGNKLEPQATRSKIEIGCRKRNKAREDGNKVGVGSDLLVSCFWDSCRSSWSSCGVHLRLLFMLPLCSETLHDCLVEIPGKRGQIAIYYAASPAVLQASVASIIAVQPGDSGFGFCGVVEWGIGAESKRSMHACMQHVSECPSSSLRRSCRVFTKEPRPGDFGSDPRMDHTDVSTTCLAYAGEDGEKDLSEITFPRQPQPYKRLSRGIQWQRCYT
jgi:hypothetical protein